MMQFTLLYYIGEYPVKAGLAPSARIAEKSRHFVPLGRTESAGYRAECLLWRTARRGTWRQLSSAEVCMKAATASFLYVRLMGITEPSIRWNSFPVWEKIFSALTQ